MRVAGRRRRPALPLNLDDMRIGPVQLLVVGFARPEVPCEIRAELERIRDGDAVRVIDALVVHKYGDDELHVARLGGVTGPEPLELQSQLAALLGLGSENGNGHGDGHRDRQWLADGWEMLDDIPEDSSAVLILLEHRWAVPLRDAIVRTGGFRMSDEFVSPAVLATIGLASPGEGWASL